MERLEVRGKQVAYADQGVGAALPLLVVHGFTGHRDDFIGCWGELGQQRRILVPDLIGHGDSDRAENEAGYSFEAAIAQLLAFLDALGIARCHLLGHSMGGMLALRMVLDHPQRFTAVMLMSTAPNCPEVLRAESFAKAIGLARTRGMASLQSRVEAVGRTSEDAILARWSERYWAHHRRRYLAMDPLAYAGFARAMREQIPVEDRLSEIRMPTGILIGEADTDFLPGADQLEAGIPNARRWTLPDAAHQPQHENPEAWQRAMREWLEPLD